jgi:lipid-A-disaccharide synthase
MLIAGEASGDLLAAELVAALRDELAALPASTSDLQPLWTPLEPRFFGAGGPRMQSAGVEIAFDMTAHSVIGLAEALKGYLKFKRIFTTLHQMALERLPDTIICVDFGGFNRRFAAAIRRHLRARRGHFRNWNPKLVQYVSPQVWASRENRVFQIARDYDLLLSIFPFEKEWYARRVPRFRVEFVGHPIVDRYATLPRPPRAASVLDPANPLLLLLPGSRESELRRHLPPMLGALALLRTRIPHLRARLVLPQESLLQRAGIDSLPPGLDTRVGGLPESLAEADLAIASTGTVTLECAWFGVPTVAMYKASWSTYHIGKRIIKVNYLAMPNILAGESLFPEFIQDAASAENLAAAAHDLLTNLTRREQIQTRLREIIQSLGSPGASRRAARAILDLGTARS